MSYSTFADAGIHINEAHSGNTKTTCPKCSDTRINKDNLCLSVNVDKGTWFCHHCEWKGSVRNGNGDKGKSKIVAVYDYPDENGKLLYQSVRFIPKSFRQRRSDGSGGWIWDLKGVRRVPYRLPELLRLVDGFCASRKDFG